MTHEKRADLILSHYQDTSATVLGHLNARNRLFLYVIALIALDFPEIDRPANATSKPVSAGNCFTLRAPVRNLALRAVVIMR